MALPGTLHGTRSARLVRLLRVAGALALVAFGGALLAAPTQTAAAGVVRTHGRAAEVDDWTHIWEVVDLLQARPPKGRVVYYLGDSTVRESLVGDESWTAEIARRSGRPVPGYTLAGHNQTFGMDLQIVRALPRSRGFVLIGVSLSRFVGPPTAEDRPQLPVGIAGSLSPWPRHHYDSRGPLSKAAKRALVPAWLHKHHAAFKRSLAANLAAIGKILAACRQRGMTPVLVDLPLNEAVVGHGLDAPRSLYRSGVGAVATRYGTRYVSFLRSLRLSSNDYFDICHLLHPGAVAWQKRLSRVVARLL